MARWMLMVPTPARILAVPVRNQGSASFGSRLDLILFSFKGITNNPSLSHPNHQSQVTTYDNTAVDVPRCTHSLRQVFYETAMKLISFRGFCCWETSPGFPSCTAACSLGFTTRPSLAAGESLRDRPLVVYGWLWFPPSSEWLC